MDVTTGDPLLGTPPILEARAASLVYRDGTRAVDGVTLALGRGEILGLVGESGSGKSSLARLLLGLVPPTEGAVRFRGHDVAALDRAGRAALRRGAQMIFQDPVASLSPRLRLRSLLREPLRVHGLPLRERWPGALALLRQVNLPESVLDKYPHQVSGGQARRFAIARALVLEPDAVIADEPTAGLDLSVQGEVVNLLTGLRDRLGLAMLMVSHNLPVVGAVADRVAVMYLGRIVESGAAEVVFRTPAHPYTRALLEAVPRLRGAATLQGKPPRTVLTGEVPSPRNPPTGCHFRTRCPIAEEVCRTMPPRLRTAAGTEVLCHKPLA